MLNSNIATYRLDEALSRDKCPLCRICRKYSEKYIWNLIYIDSSDKIILKKFAASSGFCKEHIQLLMKIIKNHSLVSRSDAARFYETIIPEFLNNLTLVRNKKYSLTNILEFLTKPNNSMKFNITTNKRIQPNSNCMACQAVAKSLNSNIEILIQKLTQDKEYCNLYRRSEGLCIPHFKKVIDYINDENLISNVKEFLIKDQKKRLRLLLVNLQQLQEKKRYDVKTKIKKYEANSWYEAAWRFSGWKPDKLLTRFN
ncbi:MAG: DUF6062 family protein [Halothermotrichaceae bacterium]